MRSLTYFVAATLDGFIAAPDGRYDFFPMSDEYLKLIVEEYPETLPSHVRAALGVTALGTRFDTVVSGFATYDVGPKAGFPSPYAHLQQYVVSTRLTEAPHPDVHVINDDPVVAVQQLKSQDGRGIYLCGGGKLAATLVSEIDELIIKQSPIVIGAGIGLFEGGFPPQQFELVESRTVDGGATFATYRRSGSAA
ncbi:MAG: dihydrofolate reductase family protein [Propionibacteriaceae bacterium]